MSRKKTDESAAAAEPALPGVNPPAAAPTPVPTRPLAFPVVGIGASAGGLQAVTQLLRELPTDTGMAVVLVQHLHPTHESRLAEILSRSTRLPVVEVADQVAVEPDHVYVIPPGKDMILGDGRLQLSPRAAERGQHRPIDLFFRSLAEHQGHRSIGVVLSGSSSDGTLGLKEIRAAGGITFAQDGTAEQTAMPHSAIAAGCVEFVLAPDDIAREIGRISRHPYVANGAEAPAAPVQVEAMFSRVLELLRHDTGVDFSNYKRNTLRRRVTRRMLLHKLDTLQDYVRHLEATPLERLALYQDVLINVTSFFRDPEAYEALKTTVFPRIVANKARDEPVRVWALGCSTGEEAYSIAMAYAEFAEQTGRPPPLQVFATDLNGVGIAKARSGVYPKGIQQDVSPERLQRFFTELDGAYQIAKPIRDLCVFARQNVLADPPLSRMDLIACRNMLIYLEPALQQKLMPILHYALQQDGFLWLGGSETIGAFRDLFDVVDSRNRIYARKGGATTAVRIPHAPGAGAKLRTALGGDSAGLAALDPQREADRILLQRYAPPGVVINADGEILQFRGDTGPFLAPAPGRASLNLLKMLREGLLVGVRGAVQRALRDRAAVRQDSLRVKTEAGYRDVDVAVIPVGGAAGGTLLVAFESPQPAPGPPAPAESAEPAGEDAERARLRQELESTREYLQSLIERQEAANEELQSANEEVQSANQELQSINEELETSQEEIQSSNEELATVNDELQTRNAELTQTNNDLVNVLTSARMAIVILGRELRIRRFTPAAERMLNLAPSDVGRRITDMNLGLGADELERMLRDVVDAMQVREQLVKDRNDRWYWLRLHPYMTQDNAIDGAVMVLVDVDQLKRAESALSESEARFARLADSAPVLIWMSSPDGRRFVNKTYLEFAGASEADVQGDGWLRFAHPDDRAALAATYRNGVEHRASFECQFRCRRADGEYRWMKTVGVPREADGVYLGHIGFKVDIHELKEAERTLRDADRSKNNFLAMLAHELRTPLAAVRNAVQIIGHEGAVRDPTLTVRAKSVIERQTAQMVRMVDDLLDLSRLTRGTFQLRRQRIDLLETLRSAIDATAYERDGKSQQLACDLPDAPIMLSGDGARLQQVFANLLGNAARYTPARGHVWVKVERAAASAENAAAPQPAVVVRVRDDGSGIDPGVLGSIFDLFSRYENTGGQGTGLGIGLNLARRLVELHGGTIEAFSAGKDQGSEFVVRLPVEEAPESADAGNAEPAQPLAQDRPLRVLVVDDNADAADMLVYLLGLARQAVRAANDGRCALVVAKEFRPDLVLLDISMPNMDGREVARRLRADPDLKSAYLVALTGFSPADAELDMGPHGFDARLTKPLENDALLALLAKVQRGVRHEM